MDGRYAQRKRSRRRIEKRWTRAIRRLEKNTRLMFVQFSTFSDCVSSAGSKEWFFVLSWPSCQLEPVCPFSSDVSSTSSCLMQNCCSQDFFFFFFVIKIILLDVNMNHSSWPCICMILPTAQLLPDWLTEQLHEESRVQVFLLKYIYIYILKKGQSVWICPQWDCFCFSIAQTPRPEHNRSPVIFMRFT